MWARQTVGRNALRRSSRASLASLLNQSWPSFRCATSGSLYLTPKAGSCGRRPPEGVAPPQEPRGRERSGIESQGQRNQNLGGERGAAQRPAPAAPSQRPSAVERGPSPGLEAPRSRAPAAEGPRPQSPTTGAAPQGGRAPPGGGGRREEQR